MMRWSMVLGAMGFRSFLSSAAILAAESESGDAGWKPALRRGLHKTCTKRRGLHKIESGGAGWKPALRRELHKTCTQTKKTSQD